VIGRLKQLQRRLTLHLQQVFLGSGHPNMVGILAIGQEIARFQRTLPGQLQQHLPATQGATTTSQRGSLFSRQRQQKSLRGSWLLTMQPFQNNQRLSHARGSTWKRAWSAPPLPLVSMNGPDPWSGDCRLAFQTTGDRTTHQGGCSAPFKLLRADQGDDGRCELPLLHTAGGLVGGDRLSIDLKLGPGSRALITSVAAQKVYGSVGRSRLHPQGAWSRQQVVAQLESGSDLEWLPQELVLYADALLEQQLTVSLPRDASFLSAEIVRLGRTAAGESLGRGCWRSSLAVKRLGDSNQDWELVDRLELGGASLQSRHGLGGAPVFGTLIWAAPMPLDQPTLNALIEAARNDRSDLNGTMRCSALGQGLVARYVGHSSRDARFWFSRLWARTRTLRGLQPARIPRVWPLQEQPLERQTFTSNPPTAAAATH